MLTPFLLLAASSSALISFHDSFDILIFSLNCLYINFNSRHQTPDTLLRFGYTPPYEHL